MKSWFPTVLGAVRNAFYRTKKSVRQNRFRPSLQLLEDRCVPSTASSIAGNFNSTAIAAGNTIWFNSSFTASGLPKTAAVTLHVEHAMIDFTAGGVAYHVAAPNSEIVLTPGQKTASVIFDPMDNDWDVSAPSSGAGDIFLGGVAYTAPTKLPGSIKNVTWSADFWSDTAGVSVSWKWAASVYKNFSADYTSLGVKAVDNKDMTVYHNGDQSGAPEAFKSFITAGATGGGGTNFTGSYTTSKTVKPTLGDGLQDYPYASSNPLTSIAFNESTVLRAANLDTVNGFFQVWYSDEHALALGVGTVVVKTASGATTTNYPIAPLTSNPGAAFNPAVGTTATSGDQAGTDISGRPMAPSLFITDTTNDPTNRSGDWQWGGAAIAPSDVFGTWKSFTRTVDYTTATPTVTVTVGVDPAKNNWNLGPGADAAPAGLSNEGYGAEIRWNLADLQSQGILVPGHTYRFYVMVHDGDQNKVGGDAGQASFNYTFPGVIVNTPADISGHVNSPGGPLAGVIITLSGLDINGMLVQATAVTDGDGYYEFKNVAPGSNYSLTQTVLPGYVGSGANAGTVDGMTDGMSESTVLIDEINLDWGDLGINYDFAQRLFNPPTT